MVMAAIIARSHVDSTTDYVDIYALRARHPDEPRAGNAENS